MHYVKYIIRQQLFQLHTSQQTTTVKTKFLPEVDTSDREIIERCTIHAHTNYEAFYFHPHTHAFVHAQKT